MVSEIYSPPRVTRAARLLPHLGITPGFALDLTVNDEDGTPWDFDKVEKRNKAVHKLLTEKTSSSAVRCAPTSAPGKDSTRRSQRTPRVMRKRV